MHALVTASLLALSTNLDNLAIAATLGAGGTIVTWRANAAIALLSGASTFVAISCGASLSPFLPDGASERVGGALLVAIGVAAWAASWQRDRGDRPDARVPEKPAREPFALFPVALFPGKPVSGEPASGEPASGEPVSGEPVSGEPAIEPLADSRDESRAKPKGIVPGDRNPLPNTLSLLQAWGLGAALTATNFCTGISAGLVSVPVELASLLSALTSLATIGIGAACGRQLAAHFTERWLDRSAGLLLAGLGACEMFVL
ncbi:MAG: hypothetical protein ACFB9N_00445 [Geitlerinemataceae cyanobacterium]